MEANTWMWAGTLEDLRISARECGGMQVQMTPIDADRELPTVAVGAVLSRGDSCIVWHGNRWWAAVLVGGR